MDELILAIQESDDQTLITVWKSVSSHGGLAKMDPRLLKAFYDEFEKRPGLLASISESRILNSRLVEMAGIRHRSDLLLEEEGDDLFGGGDEEEEGDDTDTAEDEPADEEGEDDAGAADEEEEEEEVPEKLSAKEIEELGPGEIDIELNTIMDDIFDKSQKAFEAGIQAQNESIHRNSLSSLLFENSDYDTFNMDKFARETSRYINNYQTLLDVEGMLFNKAKETLLKRFGEFGPQAVSDFEEHMARIHGIDYTNKHSENIIQPVAGVTGDGGGA